MKALYPILLLLLASPLAAQQNADYKLTINSRGMATKYNYEIELWRSDAANFIVVKKESPESPVFSTEDSLRLLAIHEDWQENKEELIQIAERSKRYVTDTLAIQNNHPVIELTDSFFNNREKISQSLNEDKRIILDGFTVKLTLDNLQDEADVLYAKSPTKESHPEVHRLITQIIQTYKQEAESPILNSGK